MNTRAEKNKEVYNDIKKEEETYKEPIQSEENKFSKTSEIGFIPNDITELNRVIVDNEEPNEEMKEELQEASNSKVEESTKEKYIVKKNYFHYLFRPLTEGIHGIFTHAFMSFSSVIVVSLTMMMLGVFSICAVNINDFADKIENSITIHVKMLPETTPVSIQQIQTEIELWDNVLEVEFSGKDEELSAIIEYYGDKGELFEIYREDNPLRDSLIVKIDDKMHVDTISNKIKLIEGVEEVEYGGENILKAIQMFNAIRQYSYIAIAILAGLALFLIANTVRLTIFARKEEIAVMNVIGASDGFIRNPFLCEGVLIGGCGAILPMTGLYFGYSFVYKVLNGVLMSNMFPLRNPEPFSLYLSLAILLLSLTIGFLGSYIASSKYLKERKVKR